MIEGFTLPDATNIFTQLYNTYLQHEQTYSAILHETLELPDTIDITIMQNVGIHINHVGNSSKVKEVVTKLKEICDYTDTIKTSKNDYTIIAYFKEEYRKWMMKP